MSDSRASPPRATSMSAARLGSWCAVALLAALAVGGASAQMAVPPARFDPPASHKAEPAKGFLLPHGAPARGVALPPPGPGEGAARKALAAPAAGTDKPIHKRRRLAVGYARPIPAAHAAPRLSELP